MFKNLVSSQNVQNWELVKYMYSLASYMYKSINETGKFNGL